MSTISIGEFDRFCNKATPHRPFDFAQGDITGISELH